MFKPSKRPTASLLPAFSFGILIALMATPLAMALGFKDTIHIYGGEALTQCKIIEMVGEHISYRCKGGLRGTTNRLRLSSRNDQMYLENGTLLLGQILYLDDFHYEIKTGQGLVRVKKSKVDRVILGQGISEEATLSALDEPSPSLQEAPEAVIGGLEAQGNLEPDLKTPLTPSTANSLPDIRRTDSSPIPSSSVNQDELTPTRSPYEGKKKQITPTISPWKTDSPYGGVDALY